MFQSAATCLEPQLDAGERLLWSGQPRGGIRLRAQDIFLVPFSLLWGGFAIFWEAMALTATAHGPGPIAIVFPLFGVPFVIMGLYLIFGRFLVDARIRARTFYGVTDKRIIIISGLFAQQTRSLQLQSLTDVSLSQRSDGSGTITFGAAPFMSGMFQGTSWPGAGRYIPPSFDLIDGVKDVYDVIRGAQAGPAA